jgi:REP element-mobilizing transposase RayT
MNKYHQALLAGHVYHLFSRAVGEEKIFVTREHYRFFLEKLKQHTSLVCSIYCYALLPNHFHLLARMHEEEMIAKHFEAVKKKAFDPSQHNLSDFIMERFSNCLNSYTKAFNKVSKRKGALFMDYLKRNCANNDDDFTTYVWYIHKNAVHHQLSKSVGEWQFDSYSSILSEAPTALLRGELIDWFGSKDSFIKFHQQVVYPKIMDIDL